MLNNEVEPLVSIIIPVYGVEKYLEKCVKSVIKQSYKNLEILLIDDGSKDKSGKICDELSENDIRIKVYHKKNGGLSDARNYGLKHATGEYIMFVDSDDYININMVKKMIAIANSYNLDIVMCDFSIVNENDKIKLKKEPQSSFKIYNKNQLFKLWNTDMYLICNLAWNKLYRKELFDKIKFPVGKIHEDEFTVYKIVYLSKKIGYIPESLYYYYQQESSIMHNLNEKRLNLLEALKERIEFSNNISNSFYKETVEIYMNVIIDYYFKFKNVKKYTISNNLIKLFKNEYDEYNKQGVFSIKQKIRYLTFIYLRIVYKLYYSF